MINIYKIVEIIITFLACVAAIEILLLILAGFILWCIHVYDFLKN